MFDHFEHFFSFTQELSLLQVVPTFSGWHGMRLTDDEQPATPTGPAVSAFESYDYQIYTSQLRFECRQLMFYAYDCRLPEWTDM